MGLDYLDMYLIHFPMPLRGLYCEAWRAMEKLCKEGLIRAIGVSNFKEHHLRNILDCCEIRPMTNEIECNPYFCVKPLREFCAQNDIRVINWFPLGGPREPLVPYPVKEYKVLLDDELLVAIGKKYDKTTAQIALRWAIDCGMVPIPKSANPSRIRENREVFDFRLTKEEVDQISALDHSRRFGPDSDTFNEDQG
jgi:diketogulonate reductase-like aldo/keto reductase